MRKPRKAAAMARGNTIASVILARRSHDAQGLRLHARTACPQWLGERLDVGWAIGVLHPLALGPPG